MRDGDRVTPTPPAAACSEPELPAGYPSPPPPLRAGLGRAVSFVFDGRRRTATGGRAGHPHAPSNSFAAAGPRRALGPPTHFCRLAISQLFTFCSRRPRNTRRSCSPSTVAWGASSRSSNRLEPAPPPPLSVDVPSSTRGRLVPLSALGHLPDRRTSSTGDILMSKMGARDALSMPVCAACFGVDHPLNVSARPAFARGPDERCCVRPRRAERVAAARRDVLPSSPAGRTCMISVQRAARAGVRGAISTYVVCSVAL